MFIGTALCNWKCCIEAEIPASICQNNSIAQMPNIEISPEKIYERYISNPITSSICFGGLEPFLQFEEMLEVIEYFRKEKNNHDTIIIYTGYYPNELISELNLLKKFDNIIIKFGRYKPDNKPHEDPVLGVSLISDNQFAAFLKDI